MFFKGILAKQKDYAEQKILEAYVQANPESEISQKALEFHSEMVKFEDAISVNPSLHIYNAYFKESAENNYDKILDLASDLVDTIF